MNNIRAQTPKWIFLQLLYACNLRCHMCYEWGDAGAYKSQKASAYLDMEAIRRVVTDGCETRPHYSLYGGEPLLYPQLDEVISCIKSHGSTVEMDTNGTLLEDRADMLVRSGLDNIFVSLDGPEAVNDHQRGAGVFQKAIKGIERLADLKKRYGLHKPLISINTAITPQNAPYLKELYFECLDWDILQQVSLELQTFAYPEELERYAQFLRKYFGVEEIRYAKGMVTTQPMRSLYSFPELIEQHQAIKTFCIQKDKRFNSYPAAFTPERLEQYFDKTARASGKTRCVFSYFYTEINAEGYVCPCHALYDLHFGNIYEDSLPAIWNNDRYQTFRKTVTRQPLAICPACCLYYNEKKYTGVWTK